MRRYAVGRSSFYWRRWRSSNNSSCSRCRCKASMASRGSDSSRREAACPQCLSITAMLPTLFGRRPCGLRPGVQHFHLSTYTPYVGELPCNLSLLIALTILNECGWPCYLYTCRAPLGFLVASHVMQPRITKHNFATSRPKHKA